MDEKTFLTAVAERAGLSKGEAADLTRATLAEIAGQISGGELQRLAAVLPDWLGPHVPRHDGQAHPKPVSEAVSGLSRRTGLTEEETRRGARAVLAVLSEAMGARQLEHALSMLPLEYRRMSRSAGAPTTGG
ncbi:MAG: hypothetical protein JWR62_2374 [Modestobacter sp.]|jgi:uncharacterized protein (DUF2267 family)|nr:hypothetical protein [Modestobacter sp.]